MEGKNSAADVVLGLDNNLLQAAQQTGLFAPSGVDTAKLTVPGGWQDATFVFTTTGTSPSSTTKKN